MSFIHIFQKIGLKAKVSDMFSINRGFGGSDMSHLFHLPVQVYNWKPSVANFMHLPLHCNCNC